MISNSGILSAFLVGAVLGGATAWGDARTSDAAWEPPAVAAIEVENSTRCDDPVVQGFAAILKQAVEVGDLARSPILEGAGAPGGVARAAELWDEIDVRALEMKARLNALRESPLGLTEMEAFQLDQARPFVEQILLEVSAARQHLAAAAPDWSELSARQDAVGGAAKAILQVVVKGRECVPAVISNAEPNPPPRPERDSFDPEYQAALGPHCRF